MTTLLACHARGQATKDPEFCLTSGLFSRAGIDEATRHAGETHAVSNWGPRPARSSRQRELGRGHTSPAAFGRDPTPGQHLDDDLTKDVKWMSQLSHAWIPAPQKLGDNKYVLLETRNPGVIRGTLQYSNFG